MRAHCVSYIDGNQSLNSKETTNIKRDREKETT